MTEKLKEFTKVEKINYVETVADTKKPKTNS